MNHCLPDWNIEGDFSGANQKKAMGPENELVELLWRNGQVVLHSQTHRKAVQNHNDPRQVQKHDQPAFRSGGMYGNSSNLIQDDDTVSWIQYPFDDSLDKEFCSNFFYELAPSNPVETAEKLIKQPESDKSLKFGALDGANVVPTSQQPVIKNLVPGLPGNPMPPPRFQCPDLTHKSPTPSSGGFGKLVNFSHFSAPVRADLRSSKAQLEGKGTGNLMQGEARECSVMTVGSSHCGSNQVAAEADFSRASSSAVGNSSLSTGPVKDDARKIIQQCERRQTETLEPTVTSSSGASGSSLGKTCQQSTGINTHKRKGRDTEEADSQSEAAELESAAGNKQTQRSGPSRRSRAAEVHNQSERRRRDRINEKMRALQELIPHCNKSDKASMLDEAIEYLKSLQLQLQLMWMGIGMAPMMFPGVQQYMSRMGMGMGPPPLPSLHNPMHLPRVPLVDQSIPMAPAPNHAAMCQTPVLSHMNYQNQMQNPNFPEQYAHYLGFHHMQTPSQPLNMFNFGSPTMQQSQTMALAGSTCGPSIRAGATGDAQSGKLG